MARPEVDLRVEGLDDIKILARGPEKKGIDILLYDAMRDIASRIETQAKKNAPQGESGKLKEHPVDVNEGTIGRVETRAPLFVKKGQVPGSRFAIRGPVGFVPGGGAGRAGGGKVVGHIEITVASDPHYAAWVHEGTGKFGPHQTPIVSPTGRKMIFFWNGHWHQRYSVAGQIPKPFLALAADEARFNYVPKRVKELREQIALIT